MNIFAHPEIFLPLWLTGVIGFLLAAHRISLKLDRKGTQI